MALKDKAVGDALDGVKVGDSELVKDGDDSAMMSEVVIVSKKFSRDGVAAKIAELEAALATYQGILAAMDK